MSPPFVYLPQLQGALRKDFAVAAQDIWLKGDGAFTGEVRYSPVAVPGARSHRGGGRGAAGGLSEGTAGVLRCAAAALCPERCCVSDSGLWRAVGCGVRGMDAAGCRSADMLVDLSVPWTIVGHSERRTLCGESSQVRCHARVCLCFAAAAAAGRRPRRTATAAAAAAHGTAGNVVRGQQTTTQPNTISIRRKLTQRNASRHTRNTLQRDAARSRQDVATKTAYALGKGLSVIVCVGETLEQRENGTTFDVIAEQLAPLVRRAARAPGAGRSSSVVQSLDIAV